LLSYLLYKEREAYDIKRLPRACSTDYTLEKNRPAFMKTGTNITTLEAIPALYF
jgi:hypothetical protein